jgi:hypothetical protein
VDFNGKNLTVKKANIDFLTLEGSSIKSSSIEGNENPTISFESKNGFYFKDELDNKLFTISNSET